jgi:basic membrane protein A and related proteins
VKHTLIRLMLVALLAVGLTAVAACGSDDSSSKSGASSTPAKKKIRVAMVTDIGGLNDRSFNSLAYKGLKEAKSELGADIRVVTSKSNADYVPNLSSLARQKYDLVVAVGFLMADATSKVAKAFPGTKFVIIDYSQAALKGKPKNVNGLLFKEQEAGYMAGYLAGLYVKKKGGKQVISSVGGQKIPPVDHYIAGFQAGAKAASPGVKTLNGYSNSFTDAAKCKSLAQSQLSQGSDVVFAVAGGCGLGALSAANAKSVWGVGVDADQNYLGPYMLTSAVKKVDFAVYSTVNKLKQGSFAGGQTTTFGIKNFAAGISGYAKSVPSSVKTKVNAVIAKIKAGKIKIPNTVK